jgi:hypothetical protein
VAPSSETSTLYSLAWIGVIGYAVSIIIYYAYRIRMGAIDEFGPVIHEFDPYFNYRATEVRRRRNAPDFLSLLHISQCSFSISICMNMARKNSSSGLITWCGIPWVDLWGQP